VESGEASVMATHNTANSRTTTDVIVELCITDRD